MNAPAVTRPDRQELLPLAGESRAVEARWTLYASTALELRRTDSPGDFPQDVHLNGVCYRLLDPAYHAWLRRGMESAKRRHDKGALSSKAWDSLRDRFNRMQAWAIDRYGKEALAQAVRTFRPDTYQPPVNRSSNPMPTTTSPVPTMPRFRFPATGNFRFEHPVTLEAVAKVDAIWKQAQALGWSEARLYQNRGRIAFPCGQDWGLVCFIDPGDDLGEITETHVEIIHDRCGRRNRLRFANSDTWPPRIQPKKATA
jgi:hypothetical protein